MDLGVCRIAPVNGVVRRLQLKGNLGTTSTSNCPSLGLLHAETHAGVRAAFCSVWRTATRAEHCHQRFCRITTDNALRLHRSERSASRSWITLVPFFTF